MTRLALTAEERELLALLRSDPVVQRLAYRWTVGALVVVLGGILGVGIVVGVIL